MIRICSGEKSLEGSSHQNYKDFNVWINLQKFAIIWAKKNNNYWNNIDNYKSKRQHRTLDVKVNYASKVCGQKCVGYLGSTVRFKVR